MIYDILKNFKVKAWAKIVLVNTIIASPDLTALIPNMVISKLSLIQLSSWTIQIGEMANK